MSAFEVGTKWPPPAYCCVWF